MEFGIAFAMGAAVCGALWWYVDSRGGAVAIEKSVTGQIQKEVKKVETQVQDEVKKVI